MVRPKEGGYTFDTKLGCTISERRRRLLKRPAFNARPFSFSPFVIRCHSLYWFQVPQHLSISIPKKGVYKMGMNAAVSQEFPMRHQFEIKSGQSGLPQQIYEIRKACESMGIRYIKHLGARIEEGKWIVSFQASLGTLVAVSSLGSTRGEMIIDLCD
jgi:hypothetical protein